MEVGDYLLLTKHTVVPQPLCSLPVNSTWDKNIFPAASDRPKLVTGEPKGSGSWVRQSYCIHSLAPSCAEAALEPWESLPCRKETHASLPVTQGADVKQAQLTGSCKKGVERIDWADQSWVQLSSEDFLEEANLEQIPHPTPHPPGGRAWEVKGLGRGSLGSCGP